MASTKQFNIERAQQTARLIAGTVLSLEHDCGNAWILQVICNNGRYDISVWNDEKRQHQYAMGLKPGDVVTLQVHSYNHPGYQPWKIYDWLVFSSADRVRCNALERKLKEQLRSIETRQRDYDAAIQHLGKQQILLNQQRAQRQTNDFWRHLAGFVGGVGSLAAAPFTGGASLLALPSCGILLCDSGAELQHQMGQNSLDFSRALADNNAGITRSMAIAALEIINELEELITNAKRQSWKHAANGNAYGLLPNSIRADLERITAPPKQPVTATPAAQPCLHATVSTTMPLTGFLSAFF